MSGLCGRVVAGFRCGRDAGHKGLCESAGTVAQAGGPAVELDTAGLEPVWRVAHRPGAPRYLVTEIAPTGSSLHERSAEVGAAPPYGPVPPGGFVTVLVVDPAIAVMQAVSAWCEREVVAVCCECSKPVTAGAPNACPEHPSAAMASLLLSRQEPASLVASILTALGMGEAV